VRTTGKNEEFQPLLGNFTAHAPRTGGTPVSQSRTTAMHPPPLPIHATMTPAPAEMPADAASKRAVLRLVLIVAVMIAGAAVLYAYNPVPESGHTSFYPTCPFYKLTGCYCPGCGGTRALHHLLHGHVATAFDFNPLLIVSLPFIVYAMARGAVRMVRPDLVAPARRMPVKWMWTILGVVVAFAVLRNLPYPAFAWMAP
jgi:hypothetical protein